MHNSYLEILGLQPGATKSEIKGAFRTLSKQYHPDVNEEEGASEKFIAVHEAYKFLTDVGPRPNQEGVTYNYDPQKAAYEDRRRQAREYAWRKNKEAQEQQKLQLQLIFKYFNYFAMFALVFNILIAVDYFLPRKQFAEQVISSSNMLYNREGNYYSQRRFQTYHGIVFENFNMKFDKTQTMGLGNVDNGIVVTTYLFQTPLYAIFNTEREAIIIQQVYSLYKVFGYIIPISFLILAAYFKVNNADHKISFALLLIMLFLIQVFLFFR